MVYKYSITFHYHFFKGGTKLSIEKKEYCFVILSRFDKGKPLVRPIVAWMPLCGGCYQGTRFRKRQANNQKRVNLDLVDKKIGMCASVGWNSS